MEVFRLVKGHHLMHHAFVVNRPHVVRDEVVDDAHATVVQALDQVLHVLLGAEVRVDLVQVVRPITHAAGAARGLALVLVEHGRDPDAVEAHALDVVEMVRKAAERAVAPVVVIVARLRGLPGVPREAVHRHEVHGLPGQGAFLRRLEAAVLLQAASRLFRRLALVEVARSRRARECRAVSKSAGATLVAGAHDSVAAGALHAVAHLAELRFGGSDVAGLDAIHQLLLHLASAEVR
mmetsp:Transcript_111349/g.319922  ORF Transcript_111349/g.319922 Transcript_111349/m.319922 type:complete len:236 (+) Transcript_111349:1319-2026(+)